MISRGGLLKAFLDNIPDYRLDKPSPSNCLYPKLISDLNFSLIISAMTEDSSGPSVYNLQIVENRAIDFSDDLTKASRCAVVVVSVRAEVDRCALRGSFMSSFYRQGRTIYIS